MARKKKPSPATATDVPDRGWMAKDDMHTLLRAEEIRADKSRHSAAQGAARKHMKELKAVVGGDRAARNKRLEDVDL
jgi:hypothetical protein